jgi:hypothetical protein
LIIKDIILTMVLDGTIITTRLIMGLIIDQ